jgi:hypothetical protein
MFSQQWFLDLLREVLIVVLVAVLGALGYHAAVVKPALRRMEQRIRELQSLRVEWRGARFNPTKAASQGEEREG